MVTTFDTSSAPTGQGQSKGSNTILIVLGLAISGYLLYRFVIKPKMEKDKEKQNG